MQSYTNTISELLLWQYPKNSWNATLLKWLGWDVTGVTRSVPFPKTHPHKGNEQDTVTQGAPELPASTHLPHPSPTAHLCSLQVLSKSRTRLTRNANYNTRCRYYSSKGEQSEGFKKKTCSKSRNTSVWVRLTSAQKPSLYQCDQKLANLFCKGPDNNILDFLVKGLCGNYSTVAWNQPKTIPKGIGMAVFQ